MGAGSGNNKNKHHPYGSVKCTVLPLPGISEPVWKSAVVKGAWKVAQLQAVNSIRFIFYLILQQMEGDAGQYLLASTAANKETVEDNENC